MINVTVICSLPKVTVNYSAPSSLSPARKRYVM